MLAVNFLKECETQAASFISKMNEIINETENDINNLKHIVSSKPDKLNDEEIRNLKAISSNMTLNLNMLTERVHVIEDQIKNFNNKNLKYLNSLSSKEKPFINSKFAEYDENFTKGFTILSENINLIKSSLLTINKFISPDVHFTKDDISQMIKEAITSNNAWIEEKLNSFTVPEGCNCADKINNLWNIMDDAKNSIHSIWNKFEQKNYDLTKTTDNKLNDIYSKVTYKLEDLYKELHTHNKTHFGNFSDVASRVADIEKTKGEPLRHYIYEKIK